MHLAAPCSLFGCDGIGESCRVCWGLRITLSLQAMHGQQGPDGRRDTTKEAPLRTAIHWAAVRPTSGVLEIVFNQQLLRFDYPSLAAALPQAQRSSLPRSRFDHKYLAVASSKECHGQRVWGYFLKGCTFRAGVQCLGHAVGGECEHSKTTPPPKKLD